MNTRGKQKPVLFAALNWGMGHASRSVPLIRALQEKRIPVILASDGVAAELLRKEFPELYIHELPSYQVRYDTDNIYWNVLRSLWSILSAIWAEHQWLRSFLRSHDLFAIISDNRYGIRSTRVPSVLITHQFRFFGPWKWANRIGEWSVRWWARKFSEIWVPDWQGDHSLSGGMANWKYTRPPVYYLGPLSRFELHVRSTDKKEFDVIVILSGPEPMRTQLEVAVDKQLKGIPGKHILIRGTRESAPAELAHPPYTRFDLLAADELNRLVALSTMQISRSGYSTVMDLTYSGIPALMIPTPGQIEQEFLAEYLWGKGPWLFQSQDKLDIQSAWLTLDTWAAIPPLQPSGKEAIQAVTSFLQRWTTDKRLSD